MDAYYAHLDLVMLADVVGRALRRLDCRALCDQDGRCILDAVAGYSLVTPAGLGLEFAEGGVQ